MNKWEESITNKSDKRELLIESSEFVSKVKLSKGLKESLSMQAGRAGTLIVKNVPVTILDRENLNGRIYSTETMRQAIEEAKEAMRDKQTLGQANEHPSGSFVAPTDASHVIINAYIKENVSIVVDGKRERRNVLFTDWEVLNTTHGKDLRALFEAECSFGTSIRGVGELSGKMVENYSFISVDGVGNPSSSTYTRMPVSESVQVEFKDANELKENYTVMSSSTNVVRDLAQAGILQQKLNANPYGTITKTSTKVDQETDPKTGAQTSITTVEADTEDDVSDLNQAFAMAHKAMTNGISKVSSVTIEANEDEDEQGNKTESVDSDNGLEAYVPESAPIEEDQITAQGQPEGIEFLKTLDEKGRYMFLGRMQADCKYFLSGGNYYNKFLWANSPEKQIEYMKWLYNSFPDDKKPQWISMEEIEDYERQMVGKGKEDHSRDEDYAAESSEVIKEEKLKAILAYAYGVDGWYHAKLGGSLSNLEYIDKQLNKLVKTEHRLVADKNEPYIEFDYMKENEMTRLLNALQDKIRVKLDVYNPTADIQEESTMTESKKEEEPKDPNEGRQYVLKIKDNDPEIKEDADNAPEFVAMKGNAIRFTKDPKKALHFTQGMEESGIVHYSNIQKLLADMGYGDQNLEKWYKKDENQGTPKKEGIKGGLVGGTAGAALGGAVAGPLGALSGAASGYSLGSNIGDDLSDDKKEESAKLTEAGNTKYSATLKLVNKAGLPSIKSLAISSVDLDGAKDELGNHWVQQEASNEVDHVEKAILVDNQSGQKYEYDKNNNTLVPTNDQNVQQEQQPQQVEEPAQKDDIKVMDPEEFEAGIKDESVDGEIKQDDKTLDMDIDDNTHVKKEFDTEAQASVAKAGIESGKLSGDVLLSDAVEPGWYVAHDKIGISGPYETREACMEGLDGYEDQVSVYEVTENDLNEVLFKNPSEPSDAYVEKPLEEEKHIIKLTSPEKLDFGYMTFEQIDNNTFKITWNDGVNETSWEQRIELAKQIYDNLLVDGWTGDEFVVDKDFEAKNPNYNHKDSEAEKSNYNDVDDLSFEDVKDHPYKKLYDPEDENIFVSFELKDDGNIHTESSFEINASDGGIDYETNGGDWTYDEANKWWKELKGSYGYKEDIEKESVIESSLVPVRFSNIKWDEKDAAYRMFEDIENDMKISHIEPDVKNANILVEYFNSYMNDLNNISITYNVNPKDIKESTRYKEEIIRLYNNDRNRKYPKIESAEIGLK